MLEGAEVRLAVDIGGTFTDIVLDVGEARKTRIFNLKRIPDRFMPRCREHLILLDALLARDANAARAAMTTYIDNVSPVFWPSWQRPETSTTPQTSRKGPLEREL